MVDSSEDGFDIIGWRERVDFPEWGFSSVLSKSDTGAQTSAIDAENIEPLRHGRVRFDAVLRRGKVDLRKTIETDVVRVAEIRSSNGRLKSRYVVATRVRIGDTSFLTEFSLIARPKMKCRILLGRTALDSRFLVDSGERYLLSKRSQPAVAET